MHPRAAHRNAIAEETDPSLASDYRRLVRDLRQRLSLALDRGDQSSAQRLADDYETLSRDWNA